MQLADTCSKKTKSSLRKRNLLKTLADSLHARAEWYVIGLTLILMHSRGPNVTSDSLESTCVTNILSSFTTFNFDRTQDVDVLLILLSATQAKARLGEWKRKDAHDGVRKPRMSSKLELVSLTPLIHLCSPFQRGSRLDISVDAQRHNSVLLKKRTPSAAPIILDKGADTDTKNKENLGEEKKEEKGKDKEAKEHDKQLSPQKKKENDDGLKRRKSISLGGAIRISIGSPKRKSHHKADKEKEKEREIERMKKEELEKKERDEKEKDEKEKDEREKRAKEDKEKEEIVRAFELEREKKGERERAEEETRKLNAEAEGEGERALKEFKDSEQNTSDTRSTSSSNSNEEDTEDEMSRLFKEAEHKEKLLTKSTDESEAKDSQENEEDKSEETGSTSSGNSTRTVSSSDSDSKS